MVRRVGRRLARRRKMLKGARRVVTRGPARKVAKRSAKGPVTRGPGKGDVIGGVAADDRVPVTLTVNGQFRKVFVRPKTTLLDLLRKDLNLKGTNKGCGTGDCGACTVIMDGLAVNSCLVLAVDASGRAIITIEGLAPPGGLHPIQKAFVEHGAVQCGFCTPGMIMSIKALLDSNPRPTEEQCKRAISGNLCRCTGYKKIVEAIMAAAEVMRDGE
jgi:carbon-monoxide dehydrogenase small subunit